MKPSLLVVDVLNDFFKTGRLVENKAILFQHINELIGWARKMNIPIIWIRQEFLNDLSDAFPAMRKKDIRVTIKGTGGEKIVSELDKLDLDYEVVKKRYSPFFKTDLDDILCELQIDTLIISGINTHACVRMTAIDAYQRDYAVIIAKDAVDSYDLEHHRITLYYLAHGIADVLSNAEILSMIKNPVQI